MKKASAAKVSAISKIALSTAVLKEAVKGYAKDLPLTLGKTGVTEIVFTDENKDLLEFLQDNIPLSAAQTTLLNKWLYGKPSDLKDVSASSVNEFFKKIAHLTDSADPLIEVKLANKWYPVKARVSKFKTFMGGHIIDFHFYAKIGDLQFQRRFYIGEWDFTDNDDKPWKQTFDEVLSKKNIRAASPEAIEKAKILNAKIVAFDNENNKAYDAWGAGLSHHEWWGFEEINVGWKDSPTQVIVESDLENENADDERHQGNEWHLPFVRVFSLKHKAYIYVDVESMKEHEYHRDGRNKIVLPQKMLSALDSIFNAKRENIFGDLFHGRHGGIVVLANGPSGVGKTLTAEVFAEFQERPLYSIEMSEIGTSVTSVEENLQKIFARAKKWNAVLLFDEADIFLSEREASDLERSAIVGIFLRLLDYYEGTFFLTTNRGEGIDKAFKSRVTLYLNYPELSHQTRQVIWENMLKAANVTVVEDKRWDEVASKTLNGRQIRNQVRLLKLMYPDGAIKTSNIIDSLEFAAI